MGMEGKWSLTLGGDAKEDEPIALVVWKSLVKLLLFGEELVGGMSDMARYELMRTEKEFDKTGRKMDRYKHRGEMERKGRWLQRIVMVLVRNGGEMGMLKVRFGDEERVRFREMMEYGEKVVAEDGDIEVDDYEFAREVRDRGRDRGREREREMAKR